MKPKHLFFRWLYFDTDKHFLQENKEKIDRLNSSSLNMMNGVAAFLFAVLSIYSKFTYDVAGLFNLYLVYFFVFFIISILCIHIQHFNYNISRYFLYFVIGIIYAFGIYIGCFNIPDLVSVMFPVFIICLPLIFILPMMEVTLFNLLFVILFIYFSRTFKEYDVAFIDQTNILACFFISTVTSYAVNHARIKELTVRYQLEHACNIDDLTQVHNRRSFNKFIVDAFDKASADKFTLMLIDIDNFKDYNASYGHICGDNCLISISKIFQDFEKKYGCYVARYGGKEFVLVDSFHSPEEISFMAKELVQTVSDLNIEHIKSTHKKVTISIGISSKSTVGITNYIDLINLADDALLQAKKSGKNTVIFATHSASTLRVTE